MAAWKYACKTMQGMELDLKLLGRGGLPLKLVKAMSGSGSISPTQLMTLNDIINPVQELQLLDVVERLSEKVARVPVVLKNDGVSQTYDMYQLGIYAEDPDAGNILYMVLQSDGAEQIPSSEEMKDFKLEWYLNISVGNTENVEVVVEDLDVLTREEGDARYALYEVFVEAVDDLGKSIADHLADTDMHVTPGKKEEWDRKMEATGDSGENTVAFESRDSASPAGWEDVAVLNGGEEHRSLFGKISTMIRNVRYLYKVLGNADISGIGNGTATGAIRQLNTDLGGKQNANTAITTENIGQQSVDYATRAGSAVDQTARTSAENAMKRASTFGLGANAGGIYTYRDKSHEAGITYATFINNSIPQIVLDGGTYDLIPNNKGTQGNKKIVNMYIDHSTNPWRLVLKIYIDGTIYTRYSTLSS